MREREQHGIEKNSSRSREIFHLLLRVFPYASSNWIPKAKRGGGRMWSGTPTRYPQQIFEIFNLKASGKKFANYVDSQDSSQFFEKFYPISFSFSEAKIWVLIWVGRYAKMKRLRFCFCKICLSRERMFCSKVSSVCIIICKEFSFHRPQLGERKQRERRMTVRIYIETARQSVGGEENKVS